MGREPEKCGKCGAVRKASDAWYKKLHEGYDLVCWDCHRDLMNEHYAAEMRHGKAQAAE